MTASKMNKKRRLWALGLLLLATCIPSTLFTLWGVHTLLVRDSITELPGGYVLSRNKPHDVFIDPPSHYRSHPSNPLDGITIAAKVDRVAIQDQWVIGYAKSDLRSSNYELGTAGFFILNTATGEVVRGLEKENWESSLKQSGISVIPELWQP